MSVSDKLYRHPLNKAVIIAGLGFFVDAFDLLLFNVLRIPSLRELGFEGDALTREGEFLLSMQMLGMIIGGIISGMLGDRRGRVYVLFGSILLYSLANLANAMVQDVQIYSWLRFLAGLGLAGELGAGISLVGESMTIERRGYGTILVATLGACGAVAAGLAGDLLPWRTTYVVAGSAGLLLLFLRMTALESGLYNTLHSRQDVRKGSFKVLFATKERSLRYFSFVLIGIPVWYSVGMLVNLTPELARLNGVEGIGPATCFILYQVGVVTGDLSSGLLSQRLKTRKRVLLAYLLFAAVVTALFFLLLGSVNSPMLFKAMALLLGLGCGYLSVFVTTVAESFGTNLRVTATSTVTNFMRGAVTLLIPLRIWLSGAFSLSLQDSLAVVGILVFVPALLAAVRIADSYGKSLDFLED
jgi:MFS family permease